MSELNRRRIRLEGMSITDPDERRRVRVQYVSRGFGLALTITDEPPDPAVAVDGGIGSAADDADDGYLTVVESGVTTLELARPDGALSTLIWDQAEVSWDSLRAG